MPSLASVGVPFVPLPPHRLAVRTQTEEGMVMRGDLPLLLSARGYNATAKEIADAWEATAAAADDGHTADRLDFAGYLRYPPLSASFVPLLPQTAATNTTTMHTQTYC